MNLPVKKLQESVDSLLSAIETHSGFSGEDKIKLMLRDSVVQRFEYTFELAWKTIQRWVRDNVSEEAASPLTRKDLFRAAARYNLIDDPEAWFEYHRARNLTSHTYDDSNAEAVFTEAKRFAVSVQTLLSKLSQSDD